MSKSKVKVGDKVTVDCTDRTGANGTFEVEVRSFSTSGGVDYVHFDRPRGEESKPAVHGESMNMHADALG